MPCNVGAKPPHLRRAPRYVVLGLLVLATGAVMRCTAAGPTPTPVGPIHNYSDGNDRGWRDGHRNGDPQHYKIASFGLRLPAE